MSDIRHGVTDYDEQGGKALGLNTLRDMEYQVPDFFVVSSGEDLTDPETLARIDKFAHAAGRVAVRSSANIEDGIHSSFAGQFDSYLNVAPEDVVDRIIDVRNSVDTDHVRAYTETRGLSFDDIRMNVIVQEFSEPTAGGVWMGNGLSSGRLEWTPGRGDAVVDGTVEPRFETYGKTGELLAKNADFILADDAQKSVAEVCKEIQEKLGYNADLEFCITNRGIQWLQLRRVTQAIGDQDEVSAPEDNTIIGEAASAYTASGVAYRLDQKKGSEWGAGKILIARATSPADMMYIMTSEGVVTKMGGMLSHSAVVCRELGKACVVGVDIDKIEHDTNISIDGKAGKVFLG